jgi:hypothetical protein
MRRCSRGATPVHPGTDRAARSLAQSGIR